MDFKLIPLNRGRTHKEKPKAYAMVDNDDFQGLSKYHWSVNGNGYVWRSYWKDKKVKHESMHRRLLMCKHGEICDHINRNPLDNRKSNLRKCNKITNGQNSNKRKIGRNGNPCSSKFKGVYFHAGKWEVQIVVCKKKVYLGRFEDQKMAALAYNESAIKNFGEYASLNKP